MMDADWTIKPRSGLGALRFGMTPDDVAALSHTYGAAESVLTGQVKAKALEDTLAQFSQHLSEEGIAAVREAFAKGQLNEPRTEALGNNGPVLDYADNRLYVMQIRAQKKDCQLP